MTDISENIHDSSTNKQVSSSVYRAALKEFEGPLDILLHFVKADELDIYNIPISKITKDFIDYLNYMKELDIELAGEFLVMATELMKIKAKMMIPQVDESGNIIEEEDPRLSLIRKLLEYKRFKDVSEKFSELENIQRQRAFRNNFDNDKREYEKDFEADPSLKNVTIYNLIKAYKRVISNIRREVVHPIELLDITPENQREFLLSMLEDGNGINFNEFISGYTVKLKIICLFLALLQLALEGFIEIEILNNDKSNFILKKRSDYAGSQS
ncbi:MAG: Segregation and condensation protein A [Ignavibacteria bacterium]|nr:Segregation and condensation protein A [Ignavibacteria bacterium]